MPSKAINQSTSTPDTSYANYWCLPTNTNPSFVYIYIPLIDKTNFDKPRVTLYSMRFPYFTTKISPSQSLSLASSITVWVFSIKASWANWGFFQWIICEFFFFLFFVALKRNAGGNRNWRCDEGEGEQKKQKNRKLKVVWVCVVLVLVSVSGAFLMGWWAVRFHRTQKQQWMVPFGLVLMIAPIFVLISVFISSFCTSMDRTSSLVSSLDHDRPPEIRWWSRFTSSFSFWANGDIGGSTSTDFWEGLSTPRPVLVDFKGTRLP